MQLRCGSWCIKKALCVYVWGGVMGVGGTACVPVYLFYCLHNVLVNFWAGDI